jgi:plasmid stabilization system protein ParE
MKPARLAPEAVVEIAEAAAWYQSQRPQLARQFLREFEGILKVIESRPASFPRLSATSSELDIRRALFPRFPYSAVFLQLPVEIRILAVAHVRRRPDYWLNRVKG